MELTREEMKKACQVAALEVERRVDRFRPDKPVIREKKGWICEQVYCGSLGDELMCGIVLQWNYSNCGTVGRITQTVHTRLRCLHKDGKRSLRLVSFHVPDWSKGVNPKCQTCGDDFTAYEVISPDTSLHDF